MVAIAWDVGHGGGVEGEARVDSRWEKVDSLVQLEQGGRNLAALPPLGPWQASLIDHSTVLPTDSPSTRCWGPHYQLSHYRLNETYLPSGLNGGYKCVLSWNEAEVQIERGLECVRKELEYCPGYQGAIRGG